MPAHDARFNTLDHFPKARSNNRHSPNVNLSKQMPRNPSLLHKTIHMSDGIYTPEDRDQVRIRNKGILQFGKSTLNRVGRSINEPTEKALKKHHNMQEVTTLDMNAKQRKQYV